MPNRSEPIRTELNKSRHGEPHSNFLIIFVFFFLKVRFGSIETNFKITEYDAFKSWRYWIMLNWSIWFDRTELFTKKHKNNQKIRKKSGTVRRDKIELVRLSSVRFENLLKFDSITVIRLVNSKLFHNFWIDIG